MLSSRLQGMKSALEGVSNSENLLLDFYGRDRLSAWLRQYPGVALWVRYRLGKPLSGWQPFKRWTTAPYDQDDTFLMDDHPCVKDMNSSQKDLIPISEGIKLVREKLRKEGSTVRIIGLSGVGKTRFAQALFEDDVCKNALSGYNVIYADLGDDINPSASELVTYLISNDFSCCLVLDNCPPDVHRKLQKQIRLNQAKLSLLTIEYDISDDRPEETEVIHIEPSSVKTVSILIQKRFPSLGPINADKISEFAGGNARVAIALASRVKADETIAKFSDEDLFNRLFNQRKKVTGSLLESAEILSLVYSFNISQSIPNDELSILTIIGGLDRRGLYRDHVELKRRQLIQERGDWRAVLPHALANSLARRALENIPFDQINTELFKPENLRLFKSCTHRLGYLHDFEPARKLAQTWLDTGGPFNDITLCSSELLIALENIAPLFPDVLLDAIEEASKDPNFCSRNNKNYSFFVQLLRKIAYDDQYFDQASKLILLFAETENTNENNNSIVNQLASLFSLHLSGTQATPIRRQKFVNEMLLSDLSRYLEITNKIFNYSLKASHWTYLGDINFGAHIRDYGWEPKTRSEMLNWYVGFIYLVSPFLESENEIYNKWSKDIISNHFRELWSYVGCYDILEEIILEYAADRKWPKMWISIKEVIHYDGKNHSPELLNRLKALERAAAPSDHYSEIEAYALTNTWDNIDLKCTNNTEKSKELHQKIVMLGEIAISKPEYLERFAPKLWIEHIDALYAFGKGLAKGSSNKISTFKTLVILMQRQNLEVVQPIIFTGFIAGVHSDTPELVREIQESIMEIPELKPHFVVLLLSTPIDIWGGKKLIELAKKGEIDTCQFQQLAYGRAHETISDGDLCTLLSAINDLKYGIFATIEILKMRFLSQNDSNTTISNSLLLVGRQTILKLLSMHSNEFQRQRSNGISQVTNECLSKTGLENEINEMIALLFEGIESNRLYGPVVLNIVDIIAKYYPENLLNYVFIGDNTNKKLVNYFFTNSLIRRLSPLNNIPVERLMKWCYKNQDSIQNVAAAVSSYISIDDKSHSTNNPKQVELSKHIKSLLNVAKNKCQIVEAIYLRTVPSSWSGSLAEILEVRSKAFSELLNHPSPEIQETVELKLELLNYSIRKNRELEKKEFHQQEQRFEW